ncbi:MAG: hypothetical protein DCC75_09420 [Proteobacteria bacterium]|nr:MAG: hypothetical protein DCC75_09420 [Pseudomonadota bacterium]
MSLFISAKRHGSPLRVIRFRESHLEVGENLLGCLSHRNLHRTFFRITAAGERFILRSLAPDLLINGKMLPDNVVFYIAAEDTLRVLDYEFVMLPCSPYLPPL